MEVKSNKATPFALSDSAKKKILSLQSNEDKRLFRVYVTGGGCSGFQYGFKFVKVFTQINQGLRKEVNNY